MATHDAERRWHILWSPSGFGNSAAKIAELWNAVRVDDSESEMYFPAYMDRLRDKDIMVPLFPNYLFLRCKWSMYLEDRIRDFSGLYMSFLKPVGSDKPHVLSEEELDGVKESLEERVELVKQWLHVGDLAVGDEVMVRTVGMTGKILYFLPPSKAMIETVLFDEPTPVPCKISDLERL